MQRFQYQAAAKVWLGHIIIVFSGCFTRRTICTRTLPAQSLKRARNLEMVRFWTLFRVDEGLQISVEMMNSFSRATSTASRDIKIEWFVVKHPCRESWKAPYKENKENPNHPQPSSSTSWQVEFLPSILKFAWVFLGDKPRRHFQDRFDFAELIKKTDHPMPFVLEISGFCERNPAGNFRKNQSLS